MIFDGKAFASRKEADLKERVEQLRKRGITPKLVSILADNSKETELYVSLKAKFAQKIGVTYEIHHFDGAQTLEIINDIREANNDPSVHGVMVQLPVVNEEALLAAISPEKDVDCLTPTNLGLVLSGHPRLLPATVKAVLEVIREGLGQFEGSREIEGEKWLAGENIVIVGASVIVGKPLAVVLSDLGATVTICRSHTGNLGEITRRANILISATGVSELVTKEMVRPGAVVIDVGISKLLRGGKFRVLGDVGKEALGKASFFTPVPGGVGPVTVACLFENLFELVQEA